MTDEDVVITYFVEADGNRYVQRQRVARTEVTKHYLHKVTSEMVGDVLSRVFND